MKLIADITPLRESREFRLLYFGEVAAALGRQITLVAAPIQVYAITESTLLVGLLGLIQFPAVLIGSTVGGLLSDALDRRRMLIVTQLTLAVITAGLAFNAFVDRPLLWLVFVLTTAQATFFAIDAPARIAAIPRLVKDGQIPAAFALQQLESQGAKAVGPAVAGFVITAFGVAAAFSLAVSLSVIAIVLIFLMLPLPALDGGSRFGLRSFWEGVQFLRSRKSIQGSFLIDINATVFGMPRALFPELGLTVLGGSEATVGLLFAAPGVGALIAAATSGWISKVRQAGKATTYAVVVWGLAIAAFGFSRSIWLALLFLGIAGAADAISAVFRATIVQLTTPDELRGRLSGLKIAAVGGGPRLGDAEAGLVARFYGPSFAAWSGGFASVIGALVLARIYPTFYNWVTPADGELAEADLE